MARPRTHAAAPRTRKVCIRLTEDEFLRRSVDARAAGLSLSGLCERLVCAGKVQAAAPDGYRAIDPALFAELRRIGNNANQIAHALNSNLPAHVNLAWQTVNELLHALMRDEMLSQRTSALRTRTPANDPPPPQTRDVFQRSVQLHSARRRQGHD